MGYVIGLFLALAALGALGGALRSPRFAPYVGLLLVAGLVALMSLALGVVSRELGGFLLGAAKWIAIAAVVLLCLRLIWDVGRVVIGAVSDAR